jgi:hypothetical protein
MEESRKEKETRTTGEILRPPGEVSSETKQTQLQYLQHLAK